MYVQSTVGKRSSDTHVVLNYRSTQGGRHTLALPADAVVTEVRSDDAVIALRPEHGELSLAALPGRHSWVIDWRSTGGISLVARVPSITQAAPASNLHLSLRLPEDRWVLWVIQRGIGPTVLYWGELLVFVVAAWLLGRSRLTPLPARDWLLLGLGLSTFSWSVLALFVLFVAVFEWRSRQGTPADARRFQLQQVGCALLAVAAIVAVVAAVPRGLLAHPDMRIEPYAGPGVLSWFVDQSAERLPSPGAISVSLWWYKLAMLAWALWLSFALTRWATWAWEVFTREGLWREQSRRPRRARHRHRRRLRPPLRPSAAPGPGRAARRPPPRDCGRVRAANPRSGARRTLPPAGLPCRAPEPCAPSRRPALRCSRRAAPDRRYARQAHWLASRHCPLLHSPRLRSEA